MKFLKDFDLKGKTVLLRSDLNSDVKDGQVIVGRRIESAKTTIDYLTSKGARVVVIAHQGSPGNSLFISLGGHAEALEVRFVPETHGDFVNKIISRLEDGEAILLENIRFHKDELYPKKRDNVFYDSKFLGLFDLYCNDSFSVSHREHTSIVGFASKMESCVGPLVEEELKALGKVEVGNPLFILSGAKPESNIKLLGKGRILSGGFFGNLSAAANGCDLGDNNLYLVGESLGISRAEISKLLLKIRRASDVVSPVDFACDLSGKRKEYSLKEFPVPVKIKDIGLETIDLYKKEIEKAEFIYMKGPLGFSSEKGFDIGTKEILKAVSRSNAFSLVGGGHLSEAISEEGFKDKDFGHVSLSGGALLEYISGGRLVGLEVLRYYEEKPL